MKPVQTLLGRRVLITGGVRRLGRTFALDMASAGAKVVVTTRRRDAQAEETLQTMLQYGVSASVVLCDVSEPHQVTSAVAEAVAFLGGLDLLVNNAGDFESARLEDLTLQQWDTLYATNTRGPFLVAQAALPHLRASDAGRIVNIGSLGGLRPWATHGHYCASKAALHMLTQVMAKAWAPEVSVNALAPGMIRFADEAERFATKTPMGRDGTPEEVAAVLRFLATAPAFLTGQIIAVDGGLGLA